MKKEEQILKCFSSYKKRRLLNILSHFPMTHKDMANVTHLNKGYIGQCLKKFVEAGLIEKEKIKGEKMVIYLRWFHNTEIGITDMKINGKKVVKGKIELKSLCNRQIHKNPLSEYPVNFIKEVFKLFQFENPQFKQDVNYIRNNKIKMRAISYLNYYDKGKSDKKIKETYLNYRAQKAF